MKIYCCIDLYRNGRFQNFIDFDNDSEFIEYLYKCHYDHFADIINGLYKVNDSDYECGVNFYAYFLGDPIHNKYEYQFSRRFDYLLPFEEEE